MASSLFIRFLIVSSHAVVREIAVMSEIANPPKSDNSHVALISSSDLNKIRHGSDKQSQNKNKARKMRIQMRLRYNPDKAGYSRITPKRKAPLTQNLRGVWE
jgi:predicted FMN-binding regulatory protein PaiB